MSSVLDAFCEAIMEKSALVKIIVYAIPIFLAAISFVSGQTASYNFWKILTLILYLGALTFGIYNVKHKKEIVLTLNPVELFASLLKALLVLVPHILVWGILGLYISRLVPEVDSIAHFSTVVRIIIWSIAGSIVLAAYICFAADLKLGEGFNLPKILRSCVEIFVSVFFFLPQLLIADALIILPIMYTFKYLNVALTHWGFVWYCSMVAVINLSVFANYLAQAVYEFMPLSDSDYRDNYVIDEFPIEDKDKLKKFW